MLSDAFWWENKWILMTSQKLAHFWIFQSHQVGGDKLDNIIKLWRNQHLFQKLPIKYNQEKLKWTRFEMWGSVIHKHRHSSQNIQMHNTQQSPVETIRQEALRNSQSSQLRETGSGTQSSPISSTPVSFPLWLSRWIKSYRHKYNEPVY